MSEPPPASLPRTGKTKKASRTGGTNVSKKLLMEFQALIAFACYDSPSIAGGGVAMTEPIMEKLMMKLCFGDNDDSDIVCYADQFLLGLNKFKGLYASGSGAGSPCAVDLSSATLEATLTVPPNLHRQGNIHIFVGDASIEKRLLYQKSLTNETPITGRTMVRLAKEVLMNCKKMQALVMSSQSPYKDFASFPSGTNYDDYLNWCLGAMFREDEATAVGRNRKNNDIEQRESTSTSTDSAILQGADESDGAAPFPHNYFFKGFLAWSLWGHLPIQNGATMKSSLFTEAKTDTAFGRNIDSRRAIKSGGMKKPGELLETSVSRSRSGRKRQVSESSGLASTSGLASPTPIEDSDDKSFLFMTQTMELFQYEFLEKELQKQRSIEIRMVRDEIASLTRKSDRLHSDYCRMKEGRAADEAKQIMDEHEQRILLLETKLKKIQEEEIERRNGMLRQHQRKLNDTNNTERHNKRPNIEEENDVSTEPPMSVVVASSQPPTGVAQQSPAVETPPPTTQLSTLVRVECSVNTTHKCHKCKQYVWTICCSEKRNLEMSWWCQECFDAESVDKQQKIRAGYYDSDDEDNVYSSTANF